MVKRSSVHRGLRRSGFTVAEMLVGLMVASIVLTAAATLAFAAGRAVESTDDMHASQRYVRYATLRIREHVRYAKWVTVTNAAELAVWTADANGDNLINASELIYIEAEDTGGGSQRLRTFEFPGLAQAAAISEIKNGTAKAAFIAATDEQIVVLVPECANTVLKVGGCPLADPDKIHVIAGFEITDDGVTTKYQTSAMVMGSAHNLIDQATGELVADDDD